MESGSLVEHNNYIREQILRAIALNRTPGYHFCGNFLDLWFEDVQDGRAKVTIKSAPHVITADGSISPIALSVAADFAGAAAIRTAGDPAVRLATVSLHLQMTGAPMTGSIVATGSLDGFVRSAKGRLGVARILVKSNQEIVAIGTSTFMVLAPPGGKKLFPIPWINQRPPAELALPKPDELSESEQRIVDRAESALSRCKTEGSAFLDAFLDIRTESQDRAARACMENGPHVDNRVGHVQGGISMGMVMACADAALPPEWTMVGITASYVSPGEGDVLTAHSEVVHKGRLTAVVSTKLLGIEGRLVLEVTTNHARKQDTELAA